MENFGLVGAFLNAGITNKLIVILLLVASVYSWSIILRKIVVNNFQKVALQHVLSKLEKDNDHLAIIASSAPFIGLLGTVIGVINSFTQIGLNASASLAVIGPGIAEALYATALGLFVAIPASMAFNFINGKVYEYETKKNYMIETLILLHKEKKL